jgi:hypothetical protein
MPAFPEGASQRGGAHAAAVHRAAADAFYAGILPVATALRGQGYTLREIAEELIRRGVPMRQGNAERPGVWNKTQVRRLLARAGRTSPVTPVVAGGDSVEVGHKNPPTEAPPPADTQPDSCDFCVREGAATPPDGPPTTDILSQLQWLGKFAVPIVETPIHPAVCRFVGRGRERQPVATRQPGHRWWGRGLKARRESRHDLRRIVASAKA